MSGPFFEVTLRLLPTEQGGRQGSISSDHRPSWNLGNTWQGAPVVDDGRVLLEGRDELAPGAEGPARIEPIASERWGRVVPGAVIAMQEGPRVVGHATIREIVARPAYWSPEVAAFVDQARQLCDFVERAGALALDQRLEGARQRLLALYAAGAMLPRVEPPDDVEDGPAGAAPAGWAGFERFDVYREVFDPYEEGAPVAGSLSDDLLGAYGDVRRGLALWDDGGTTPSDASRLAAIWEWRFHFEIHWGDHAIDALRALHRACARA